MNLRENVKKLCALRGTSQAKIAEKMGITNSTLNISIGKNANPNLASLNRLADALEVPLTTLLAEDVDQLLTQTRTEHQPKQGIFCPHCGKPLTLFVKAEDISTLEGEEAKQ